MTLQEYLTSLRHKTVAVIGIGVSNTPLLRRLLAEGIAVTACDRSSREKLGPLADELEAAGATLHLGEGYLDGLTPVSYTHLDVYKRQVTPSWL